MNKPIRPAALAEAPIPNRLHVLNHYTVIDSHTFHRADATIARIVILAARANNLESDDYEYVTAELDSWADTGWPQGRYTRTLPLAVAQFQERVAYIQQNVQFPVVRNSWEA